MNAEQSKKDSPQIDFQALGVVLLKLAAWVLIRRP